MQVFNNPIIKGFILGAAATLGHSERNPARNTDKDISGGDYRRLNANITLEEIEEEASGVQKVYRGISADSTTNKVFCQAPFVECECVRDFETPPSILEQLVPGQNLTCIPDEAFEDLDFTDPNIADVIDREESYATDISAAVAEARENGVCEPIANQLIQSLIDTNDNCEDAQDTLRANAEQIAFERETGSRTSITLSSALIGAHPVACLGPVRLEQALLDCNMRERQTNDPNRSPTFSPSNADTSSPSNGPTFVPTLRPSSNPSSGPSVSPTFGPSSLPSSGPSTTPSVKASSKPSAGLTNTPTGSSTIQSDSPSIEISDTTIPTSATSTEPTVNQGPISAGFSRDLATGGAILSTAVGLYNLL